MIPGLLDAARSQRNRLPQITPFPAAALGPALAMIGLLAVNLVWQASPMCNGVVMDVGRVFEKPGSPTQKQAPTLLRTPGPGAGQAKNTAAARQLLEQLTARQILIGVGASAAALGVAGLVWSVRRRRRRRAAESAVSALAWCTARTHLTAKEAAIVSALAASGSSARAVSGAPATAPWSIVPGTLRSASRSVFAVPSVPPVALKCELDSGHLGPHLALSHSDGDDQHWLLWTPSTRQITQLDPCPVTGSTAEHGRWGRMCLLPASHEGRHTFEQTGRTGSHVRVL